MAKTEYVGFCGPQFGLPGEPDKRFHQTFKQSFKDEGHFMKVWSHLTVKKRSEV